MLDEITQYILALVPAVSAIMGMVVIVGIGVGKIKNSVNSVDGSLDTIKSENKFLKAQLSVVQKENIEIKREMTKLMKKVEHIHFVDKREE